MGDLAVLFDIRSPLLDIHDLSGCLPDFICKMGNGLINFRYRCADLFGSRTGGCHGVIHESHISLNAVEALCQFLRDLAHLDGSIVHLGGAFGYP